MPAKLELLEVEVSEGVRTITIHHKHPACVMTLDLSRELATAIDEAEADDATRVTVFRSADPDFFIAHFDVSEIVKWADADFSSEDHPFSNARLQAVREGESRQRVRPGSAERLRTSSMVSIAEIAGRAGGGGNEFCSGCDMRFGLAGKTKLNQMEVPLGILPGGNGTVNLPKLMGRGRALEVILGGVDIDAETAERWGYLNRIFPSKEALSAHVDALARRIASFPTVAVANAKQSVLNSLAMSQEEALNHEYLLFAETLKDPASKKLMTAFLEERGGQTREGELKVGELAPYLPFTSL
jgi:enoyl-CoA hydratase/carnithine racemase